MSKIIFENKALDHLNKWAKENPKILKRIVELMDSLRHDPFHGIGKPEGLNINTGAIGREELQMNIA